LGKITVDGPVPAADLAALKLDSGAPAVAGDVQAGQARLLAALQEDSFALASVDGPDALADDQNHRIDLAFTVKTGPKAQIGAISFHGLTQVDTDVLNRAVAIQPGDPYKPSAIDRARRDILALGVFSSVTVMPAQNIPRDDRIPLVFEVQESPRHVVTLGARYSTDLGIGLSATWSDRNLLGGAEQLNLRAEGTGLGTASAGLGYRVAAQFIKPQFPGHDQSIEGDLEAVKEQLTAYDQTAQTATALFRETFSPLWRGSGGVRLQHDLVTQQGQDHLYEVLALPVTGSYDSTGLDDPLADPLHGARLSLAVTPTQSFGPSSLPFLVLQASATGYFDVSGDGRSVFALRALAGSILGGSVFDLPPDQRLYAGGSATVRGFAYQSIGPKFPDGKPIGAKSVDAASLEFRQRVLEDWGAAVFLDAGQASAQGMPFQGTLRAAAGLGARYYTPIGVVRADVAVPLNRPRGGDAFEVYIGLGQAF
jgi:translocation and assembly module TamA